MNPSSALDSVPPRMRAEPRFPRWRTLAIVVLLALAAGPWLKGYQLFQVTMICVYAVALLGLNVLTGYSGQISLGHGAFLAFGAYTAAILMNSTGAPYWLAIPGAAAMCFVLGVLFGLPALRLEGHYLALATFALAMATPQLLKHDLFAPLTGGVQGISLSAPLAPFGLPISPELWLYLVALAIAVLAYVLARNLMSGRTGLAIVSLREHPAAASAMGINVAFYKAMAFGISAMYVGVAGALSALAIQFISPDSFGMFLSITLLVGAVVGGVRSLSGALWGACFIQLVPNVAEHISKSAPWTVYGLVLLALVYLAPSGIAGIIERLQRRN